MTERETHPINPREAAVTRFLIRLAGLMRGWLWLIGAGIVMVLIGVMPSVFVILAMLGVVVVPILVLCLWGRLLDEMVTHRRNRDGGWS
ncbi:MAG: hypothetical protein AAF675_04890 [Pseudomonadota bacterium]